MKPTSCPKCGAKEGYSSAQIKGTFKDGREVYRVTCWKCKADTIVDKNGLEI